jgi:hypothetical protein
MKIQFMRAVIAVAAITALGQADSRSSRWRRFDAYAMLAPATLTALTFGMIDVAGLGRPNASTLWISAAVVLTCLWCGRPAHPPVKLRFLREPRVLTGAVIALRARRSVILAYLPSNIASARTSSCAFNSPAMQPWDKAHEHLARHQVPSEYRSMPANASRPSAHAKIAAIAGTAASLSGLTQRLSPSVA